MSRTHDRLPDWFFGGMGKRELLRRVAHAAPDERLTQRELARAAGLHEKGGAQRHLEVMVLAGLLRREKDRGPYIVEGQSPLLKPLREWLAAVDGLASEVPEPLPPSRGRARS